MCAKTSLGAVLFLLALFLPTLYTSESLAQVDKTYGLAVMRLRGIGISEAEAEALTEAFHTGISQILLKQVSNQKEKYQLLERSQMDKMLEQFQVQDLGCTDEKCAVEFGKMLAVERIIIGSIGLVGETYNITGRIVDVESSKVIRSVSRRYQGKIDGVLDILPLVGHELLTGVRLPEPVKQPTLPGGKQPDIQPGVSYLSIEGTPASAEALINGQSIGETPVQAHELAPGQYTAVVRKTGFKDFTQDVFLGPGKLYKLYYSLTAVGLLTCKGSPEGAIVSIDGREAGKTPLVEIELPLGKHAVKISRDGYMDYQLEVTLTPGEIKEVTYILAALAKLTIESLPEGANVYINGKRAGETPLRDYTVVVGDNDIALKRMGYETHRERVTVTLSAPMSISPVLVPKTKSGALKRSIFFPGSGQWYAEYKGKGAVITALQIATLAGAVAGILRANDTRKKYDEAYDTYKRASLPGEITAARADMNGKYDKVSSAETLRLALIGAAVAVYVYNLIDAAFTTPKIKVKPPSASLRFEPYTNNGVSGISASLRF